jgi:GNAT superfamily N-acetyltransferase
MTRAVTVRDCEQAQTAWFLTRAELLGGEAWRDRGLVWASEPGSACLLFPEEIRADALAAGLERVRAQRVIVGAWLSRAVDPEPLHDAGFERGWSPWWMTARIDEVGLTDDPRVELREETTDYGGGHASYARSLALTRARPKHTWYAAAHEPPGRRFAGHAWSHLVGDVAGIFDMSVWPAFQRRGLGTALLRTVCAAAGAAGAVDAVLNATPEGKKLYETCGFTQIGEGITWWLHP